MTKHKPVKPAANDPKLTAAGEEIRAILTKYDIGGACTLGSETHAELVIQFPTWSAIQMTGTAVHAKLPRGGPNNQRSILFTMALRDGLAMHAETLNMAVMQIMDRLPRDMVPTLPGLPTKEEPRIIVPKMRPPRGVK